MTIQSEMKMRGILSNICDNPGRYDGNLADVISIEEHFDLFEECLDIMVRVEEVSKPFSADNYPNTNWVSFISNAIYNQKETGSRTVNSLFSVLKIDSTKG